MDLQWTAPLGEVMGDKHAALTTDPSEVSMAGRLGKPNRGHATGDLHSLPLEVFPCSSDLDVQCFTMSPDSLWLKHSGGFRGVCSGHVFEENSGIKPDTTFESTNREMVDDDLYCVTLADKRSWLLLGRRSHERRVLSFWESAAFLWCYRSKMICGDGG